MIKNTIRALLLTFFLSSVFAPSAFSMTKAKAATLLKQQKWSQAQAAYMKLLPLFPEDKDVVFGLAMAAQKNRDYTRAVIFFEILTERFPEDKQFWANLAEVYTALGNKPAAQYARRMGKTAQKKSELLNIHAWLEMGVFHDDNIFFQPDTTRIDLATGTLHLDDKKYKATPSWGGYTLAAINIDRRFQEQGSWSVVADASGQSRYYFKEPDAKTDSARIAAGLRYAVADYEITAKGKAEHYAEDFNSQLTQFGAEGLLSWRIFPEVYLTTRGTLTKRKYQKNSDLNATYGRIGEYLHFLWEKNELVFGGDLITNRAKEEKHSYNGWQACARTGYAFSNNIKCWLEASLEHRKHDKPPLAPPLCKANSSRKDKRSMLGARLRYSFTENLSLEAAWSHVRNNSNVNLFDYVQNVFSTGLTWEF